MVAGEGKYLKVEARLLEPMNIRDCRFAQDRFPIGCSLGCVCATATRASRASTVPMLPQAAMQETSTSSDYRRCRKRF